MTRRITPVFVVVAMVATLIPAVALAAAPGRSGNWDVRVRHLSRVSCPARVSRLRLHKRRRRDPPCRPSSPRGHKGEQGSVRSFLHEKASEAGAHDPAALADQLYLLLESGIVTAGVRSNPEPLRWARAGGETLIAASI